MPSTGTASGCIFCSIPLSSAMSCCFILASTCSSVIDAGYAFLIASIVEAAVCSRALVTFRSTLLYRAVSQGTIRFNPFEEVKYEAVENKPRFLSKGDVEKLLVFPLQDEGAELSRRMFLFSVFTGLAFADLQSLRASQIETNSEGKRYIRKTRQKTEVESNEEIGRASCRERV